MTNSAPTFHPDEFKRRVNLLLNELIEMGLDVGTDTDEPLADFIASNEAGLYFLIGLDENGLKIRHQTSFEILDDVDLQDHASSFNAGTKVCRVFSAGNAVSLNAFYPLIPSTGESEFGMFMTYVMDDIDYIHAYVQNI